MVARFVMKFKKQRIISIITVVTMAIVLSFVFVACNKPDGKDPGDKDLIEPPKKELSASEIYRQVNPSVAFVLIENLSGYSSGSGFFIDSNGTLITNYHVIDDGLSGAIQLYDGTVATIDSVIGYDKNQDIAILSTSAKNTSPVKIADSIIQVGETVYAIGYPEAFKLGFSSSTFTSGMVSMNRSIEGYSYIQSTVNITHGNSGGALINKYGEVVGITTSGITYGNIDYMNLSIPIQRIDTVSRTANEPLVIVTRRKYPVYATFYSDGAKYTTQTLSYEGRASVPTAPVKAGYTLDGWYADSGFTEKFDFNKKITSDVSIYAKWSVTTYTIDYNLNSGSWNGSSPSTTYTLNDCGVALPVPTREGYIFEGWKNLSGNFISNYPDVNHLRNLSLYASWIEGTEGLVFSTYYTNYASVTGYNGNADNVVIPKTYRGIPVKEIKDYAFRYQTRLKSITLPDSVTSIGNSAFYGCSGLTSITIPDRVTSIDNEAFSGCTGLTSIIIPNNVTSIGEGAFSGCSSLESITIPFVGAKAGVTSSDKNQYPLGYIFGTSSYTGGVATEQYYYGSSTSSTTSDTYYIPSSLKSVTITGGNILYNAFSNCSRLTNVTIGNSVTSIGSKAFYNCTGLTSVTIGNGVTNIGGGAFSGCTGLTGITIPNSVTSIGSSAFYNTAWYNNQPDGLVYAGKVAYKYKGTMPENTSLTLKEGTLGIAGDAFRGCSGLTSITIPDSVTSIGDSAFRGCSSLESITIPFVGKSTTTTNGYEQVFGYIFGYTSDSSNSGVYQYYDYGNSKRYYYYIPSSIKSVIITGGNIPSYAFYNCTSITSITIPDSVTCIGDGAFNNCEGLTSVTIPDSVTNIGNSAFAYCSGLTSITVERGNTKYYSEGNCLIETESKTLVFGCKTSVIPDSVTNIGNSAFAGCEWSKSLIIPDGVTSIGGAAFMHCTRLTSITIPASVTNIGNSAFIYCIKLTRIAFNGTIAQWNAISKGDYWKKYMPSECKVICTDGTVSI